MTVESTTRRAGPYLGNGVTTSFPFDFKVFSTSDIALTVTDADGITTALVLDTDYSITLNPDQDSDPGGSITYPLSGDPLATDETLVGVGNIPYDQTTDLPSGGPYRAATVESAFDRTVYQIQQLAELAGRSLALPPSAASADTELPAPVANNIIGWNETADALVNYTPGDLATVVVAGTSYFDVFSGDGAQTQFVLTANPGSVNALDVALDGVPQKNGIDFTVSGTTLTLTAAPGAGMQNIAVRYVAAVPVGSANAQDVAFLQNGTGAVARTAQDKMRDVISVTDFGADLTGATDTATKVQSAITYAALTGAEVIFPAGLYRLGTSLIVPRNVTLRGLGFSYPVAGYNPTQQKCGAVLYKAHAGHCISVTGSGAYSESAGIYGLTVISSYVTWASGDGIRVDQVGNYTIEQCSVWSCGGNGITVGVTAGDVTGQVFLRNCYVNNCNGYAYNIRSKWLRAYNIISDGCTWGMWVEDGPEGFVDGFHFEGFSVGGIRLAGGCTNFSFVKGFVALTNGASLYGLYVESVAGNTGHTVDAVKFVGRSGVGVIGANILGSAWHTRFSKCMFNSFPVGIANTANYTGIESTVFDTCALPIRENGTSTRIRGCTTLSTSGAWSIDHQSGGGGAWTENYLDMPIKATSSGSQGNYGTNLVVNNTGFKTRSAGQTGAIASGTAIPHGLSVTPQSVLMSPVNPFTLPSTFTVAFDATNITPTWGGGGNLQLSWLASAVCANQA